MLANEKQKVRGCAVKITYGTASFNLQLFYVRNCTYCIVLFDDNYLRLRPFFENEDTAVLGFANLDAPQGIIFGLVTVALANRAY